MFDVLEDLWSRFKILVIAGLAVLILLAVVPRVVSTVMDARANKTPIEKIEATNDKEYKKNEEIKPTDFKVVAIHENGRKTRVKADEYKISRKTIEKIGKNTEVTITLKSDEDIFCTVKVKSVRKKVREFTCGFPEESAVKAVLYSNGELAFEGEGNVRDFSEYPWLDYDEERDYPITSVSFGKKVTPQYMDGWFSGLKELTYVDAIPSSVQSMNGTFKDCESLPKGADWGACSKLVDISGVYEGCEALEKVPAIPQSVRLAVGMCSDCISLVECPEMKDAISLQDLSRGFSGCTSMTSAKVPDKVTNLEGTFEGCINITEMPRIPAGVTNMNDCFKDNTSMQTFTNIPASCIYANNCFEGCIRVSGPITIDATLQEYSGIFNKVASATTVDVRGSGANLNDVVWSAENPNITVNNKSSVDPDTLEETQPTEEMETQQ